MCITKSIGNIFELSVSLLFILVLTSFQSASSLPLHTRPSSDLSQGHGESLSRSEVSVQGEEKKKRRVRDIGLVQENETAAGVIYRMNERE